jgi:hypothetical protein
MSQGYFVMISLIISGCFLFCLGIAGSIISTWYLLKQTMVKEFSEEKMRKSNIERNHFSEETQIGTSIILIEEQPVKIITKISDFKFFTYWSPIFGTYQKLPIKNHGFKKIKLQKIVTRQEKII